MKTRFMLMILTLVFHLGVAYGGNTLISSGNQSYPPSSWQDGDAIVGVAAELSNIFPNRYCPKECIS